MSPTVQPLDLLLFGTWCIVTAYYFFIVIREWIALNTLKAKGAAVEGTVFDKETRQSRGSKNRKVLDYYVIYQYQYGSQQYQQAQQIGKPHFDQIETGQRVEVVCLPDNPQKSQLAGKDLDNSKFKRQIVVAVLCGALFVFLAVSLFFTRH